MADIVKPQSMQLYRICVPKLEAMAMIGISSGEKRGEALDPTTATYWCFDDNSTVALDDRTQIAY